MFACEICEIFKNIFFYRTPPVAASEWTLLSSKMRNTRINMTFSWFLACFKDIFDSRILFPELVAETKHYLFGFDAIQFFLSSQWFWLLITTIKNIYISNKIPPPKKNKQTKKQLYKLKALMFKLLNDSYLFKVLQKIDYNIFLYSRIGYWGHINNSISIL